MVKIQMGWLLFSVFFLLHCAPDKPTNPYKSKFKLSQKEAEKFVALPLSCTEQEFPNKLGQVLTSEAQLKTPKALHPAFYGCFDWHSAVHGHWVLATLLRTYPELQQASQAKEILTRHLSASNIQSELAYFQQKESYSYERTYGWAWLLKLQAELKQNKAEWAQELAKNLQPLSDVLVERYKEFTPKLVYPIRAGTHQNTAFGLSLAHDYATAVGDVSFQDFIKKQATRLFSQDLHCQLQFEPSGSDFLSPCFEQAFLMSKVMEKEEYASWLENFLPILSAADFNMGVAEVSDRTDGHLVHLDGLNFSRAWCLRGIAKKLPERYGHLLERADAHIAYSLPNLVGDSYEGGHWLASFAILALSNE